METIIQAGNKRLRIASVPVVTNAKTRESRLFKNAAHHMLKSASAIMRSYLMFNPYVIFATLAVMFAVLAAVPFVRFIILWVAGDGVAGHLQSLIFGSLMAVAALLSLALGVLSDLLRSNRILLEEQLERIKEIQYGRSTRAVAPAGSGDPAKQLDGHDAATNSLTAVQAELGI